VAEDFEGAAFSNAIKELVATGAVSSTPEKPENGTHEYVMVPEGFHLESLESYVYNKHRTTPERIKQNISVLDPDSFVNYYNLFGNENSRVFADERNISVAAVLDYHGAKEGHPQWGEHHLKLTLQKSPEWTLWTDKNNKKFSQQEFGEFLEQHSLDISDPAPARMVEVARDLEATTSAEFGSGLRMADGQVRFKYTETTNARVGNQGCGDIQIPEEFTLFIPVFVGGAPVELKALLRFRVPEGKLSFWFTLIRPESVMRDAFIAARNAIASSLGITILNGTVG
jgi:uncharacterized protein YfdQ (DUF2303 family)